MVVLESEYIHKHPYLFTNKTKIKKVRDLIYVKLIFQILRSISKGYLCNT